MSFFLISLTTLATLSRFSSAHHRFHIYSKVWVMCLRSPELLLLSFFFFFPANCIHPSTTAIGKKEKLWSALKGHPLPPKETHQLFSFTFCKDMEEKKFSNNYYFVFVITEKNHLTIFKIFFFLNNFLPYSLEVNKNRNNFLMHLAIYCVHNFYRLLCVMSLKISWGSVLLYIDSVTTTSTMIEIIWCAFF